MRYGMWLSWGSIVAIVLLSVMSFLRLITPETLGVLEALLLCSAWLGAGAGKHPGRYAKKFVALSGAMAVIAVVWLTRPVLFIYVPAIGVNLLLAAYFFSTLRPGSEPVITRIARVERQDFDDVVYAYTRNVTWAWALFFTGLLIEAVALIAFAPVETTLLFLNFINYVLIAIFFLAEYVYRRLRLRRYTHMSPLLLAARLSRRGIMSVIKYRGHG
jgi:uncharacterized membrane protein